MLLENLDKIERCIKIVSNQVIAYNKFPIRDYKSYGKAFSLNNILFELGNIYRFYLGGNNMFNPSIMLSRYGKWDRELYKYYEIIIKGIEYEYTNLPKIIKQNIDLFLNSGILSETEKGYKCLYRIIEFEGLFFITDMYSHDKDMVWLSSDSLNTARSIKRVLNNKIELPDKEQKISLLDLCCGSGLVGCYTAKLINSRLDKIYGLDINPRAVEQTKTNCLINGFNNFEFIAQSIYDYNFTTEFDVIVSNPAYGSSPYEMKRLCHASGETGIEQVLSVFNHIVSNLSSNGIFFVMADSPVINNKSLLLSRLDDYYKSKLEIVFENLYTYQSSGMTISSENHDEDAIDTRQRVFIYGKRATNRSGKILYKENRLFSYLNKF